MQTVALPEIIVLRRLGHVFCMPAHCSPSRAHFALVRHEWKMRRSRQAMIWRRGMEKLPSALALVGASWLPPNRGLFWVGDRVQNRSQWPGCCMVCLQESCPVKTYEDRKKLCSVEMQKHLVCCGLFFYLPSYCLSMKFYLHVVVLAPCVFKPVYNIH